LKYIAKLADLPPSAEYFSRSPTSDLQISSSADWKKSSVQLKVLEARAQQAVMKLRELVQQGTPWKDINMDCVAVSRAHIEVFTLRTFVNTTTDSTLHNPLTKLQNLVIVFLP
jgi:Acyl-CoA oxidase